MPGKGRRVAVRQAELRSRRRRSGQASASPAGAPAGVAVEDRTQAVRTGDPAAAPAASGGSPRPAAPAQRTLSGRTRTRADQPLAYSYVGAELRRISIVSGAVIAVLVVLAFLLR